MQYGNQFQQDPRNTPEDMEVLAEERRARMSGDVSPAHWERWAVAVLGVLAAAGVTAALVTWLVP